MKSPTPLAQNRGNGVEQAKATVSRQLKAFSVESMARVYQQNDELVRGYRLIRFLGRGGFGEVWQASGPGGTEVAFKIIPLDQRSAVGVQQSASTADWRALELVKKIRHPNLVPIIALWLSDKKGGTSGNGTTADDPSSLLSARAHTLGEFSIEDEDSQPEAIFMALGLGEKSVLDRFRECKEQGFHGIPVGELIGYLEDAARGLDHLGSPKHDLGNGQAPLPHGAVKPQNILIVGGAAQVSDFGLVRVLGLERSGLTPAFTAPEVLEEGQVSTYSDQYSLAVSYYYLRTGALPFSQNESEIVLTEIREGRLDLTRLSPNEQQVIRRATSRRPDSRFANCSDMVRDLRHVFEHRPISTPGEANQEAFIIEPGREIVPGHKLVRLIGRGAYGEVWEAQAPGRLPVALKIIKDLDRAGGRGRQEFRALEIIRQVSHNGLMELRAYWVMDRHGHIIPDEVRGQPGAPAPANLIIATRLADQNMSQILQNYREQRKPGVPPKELFGYLRQVASALDYLNSPIHKLGERLVSIQHRDVKPDNIMLANDVVKLTDFGLAKIMENDEISTEIRQDSIGFTFHYAAPEVLRGKVTRWSDQYSLAITYFQLRTGTLPYGPEISAYDQMMRQLEGQLDLAILPLAERRVLGRATHVIPEERYPTCRAFIEALASVVPNMGVLLDYQHSVQNEDQVGQAFQPDHQPREADLHQEKIAFSASGPLASPLSTSGATGGVSTKQVHKAIRARPTMRIVLRADEIYPAPVDKARDSRDTPHSGDTDPDGPVLQLESTSLVASETHTEQSWWRFWPLAVMFFIGIGMAVLVTYALKLLDQQGSGIRGEGAEEENRSREEKGVPELAAKTQDLRMTTKETVFPPTVPPQLPDASRLAAHPSPPRVELPTVRIFGISPREAGFSEFLGMTVDRLIATCYTPADFTQAYRDLEQVPQPMITAKLLMFRAECQLEGENKNVLQADFWLNQALGLEEPSAYARYLQARIWQERHQPVKAAQILIEVLKDDMSLRGFRLKRCLAIFDEALLQATGLRQEELQRWHEEVKGRLPQ